MYEIIENCTFKKLATWLGAFYFLTVYFYPRQPFNPIKMQLHDLKEWYLRHKDFWTWWKNYEYNGLDSKDIVAIETFRDNHFSINTKQLETFHEKDRIIERLVTPLVDKFRDNYPEYKEWVCIKFQFFLVKTGYRYGIDSFFETPIKELNVNTRLKEHLLSFGFDTVQQITDKYGDRGFYADEVFVKVLKFGNPIIKNSAGVRIQTASFST